LQDSGALNVDGATYFSHDGLTLVRQDASDWALLAGSSGLRAVSGVVGDVSVKDSGSAIVVTQTGAGGQSTVAVTKSGPVLQTSGGQTLTLPVGVPATAGVFLLPLP
jgi:hypothetical protein